jgi:hypothetical protein
MDADKLLVKLRLQATAISKKLRAAFIFGIAGMRLLLVASFFAIWAFFGKDGGVSVGIT